MTLRHIVTWKLAAADEAGRDAAAVRIAELLNELPPLVPAIRTLTVGRNVVESPSSHDVALVADFDDEGGLEAYQVHPEHQRAAAEIRTLVSDRAVVDFLV